LIQNPDDIIHLTLGLLLHYQGTKWRRNIAEISTGWVRRTNVTDDRQTDGRQRATALYRT